VSSVSSVFYFNCVPLHSGRSCKLPMMYVIEEGNEKFL